MVKAVYTTWSKPNPFKTQDNFVNLSFFAATLLSKWCFPILTKTIHLRTVIGLHSSTDIQFMIQHSKCPNFLLLPAFLCSPPFFPLCPPITPPE